MPQRGHVEWYTPAIRKAKQERRQSERKWRKTELEVHRQRYVQLKSNVNMMISNAKTEYYKTIIAENKSDPKKMFGIVSELLGRHKERILPPNLSIRELVLKFNDYFIEKVNKIRATITDPVTSVSEATPPTVVVSLTSWQAVTEDEVKHIINKSPSKSCSLDPIPTECVDPLLPVITRIINDSLASGIVPSSFKCALVTPLIKKPQLDPSILANYRPVSNLPFLSKVLEKVVLVQLTAYLQNTGSIESLQSAYRKHHSTETALIKIQNDLLVAMSKKKANILILLDLSAAFDTVDHYQLLTTLKSHGIDGTAWHWFSSYLTNRSQRVTINDEHSESVSLQYGVPKGSVLGPVLFTLYTASLGKLLQSFAMNYHFYADDSSLYLSFEPADLNPSIVRVQQCIEAIRSWMAKMFLKMNDAKTEVILISSKTLASRVPPPTIQIGTSSASPSDVVKSLGVLLDRHLTMEQHIASVCKSATYHLYNIRRIRKYLSRQTTEQLIHAFVTSKLDYCNALYYNLPQRQIQKLQRIQHSAARIITFARRDEHMTPYLYDLHWLPVKYRIIFKILIVIYKCVSLSQPCYLANHLTPVTNERTLRSQNLNLLSVPLSSSQFSDRAFSFYAPKMWNEIPQSVKNCDFITFKQRLKTFLFNKCFYT